MAEVSFHKEIESLHLGAGDTFYGEGILAVTKALLQSGVAYVGGYQGAPVSHLLDVLVQSEGLLADLGIHLETCTNEAAAAAMLAASINYPLRGAVTWKSIVGTNVAADALSNLASPGVQGGALIIVGEDYGEGASVIQERTHAFAVKSSLWLIDPRPDLPTLVRAVEKGFELSEASNTPVILELRIRACHMFGSFLAKDNVAAAAFGQEPPGARPLQLRPAEPSARDLPPGGRQGGAASAGGAQVHRRQWPQRADGAGRRRHRHHRAGRAVQRAERPAGAGGPQRCRRRRVGADAGAQRRASAGAGGDRRLLRRQEGRAGGRGGRARFHRAGHRPDPAQGRPATPGCYGKDVLPMAGEYTPLVVGKGLAAFLARHGHPAPALEQWIAARRGAARRGRQGLGHTVAGAAADLLHRLPGAAGILGHEAAAQGNGAGARLRRHRLPLVCDLRALQPGQLDPGLRHVAGLGRRGVGHADQPSRSASWATAASGTTA